MRSRTRKRQTMQSPMPLNRSTRLNLIRRTRRTLCRSIAKQLMNRPPDQVMVASHRCPSSPNYAPRPFVKAPCHKYLYPPQPAVLKMPIYLR